MCSVRVSRLIDLNTLHGRELNGIAKLLPDGTDMNQVKLPWAMVAFSSHDCSVPRDRYFGILGMIDEDDKEKALSLRPDYTCPMREITMRFWKYALQTDSGGELLLCAGLPGRAEEYPSWIRDLSAPKSMKHVWQGRPTSTVWHAAGGLPNTWSVHFSKDDSDQCFVQGHHIDDITDKSPAGASDPFNYAALALWIQEAFDFFAGPESSVDDLDTLYPLTSDPVHEAVLKVMLDYNKQDTMSPDDEEFKALLRVGMSLPCVAFSEDVEPKTTREEAAEREVSVEESIQRRIISGFQDERSTLQGLLFRIHKIRGLGFYKTKKGLFALLPKFARPGDSLWIIRGCYLPIALRPSISHVDSLELIGGGYVYGVMNGELLEKPDFRWQEVSLR
jgi:hypothetical protein